MCFTSAATSRPTRISSTSPTCSYYYNWNGPPPTSAAHDSPSLRWSFDDDCSVRFAPTGCVNDGRTRAQLRTSRRQFACVHSTTHSWTVSSTLPAGRPAFFLVDFTTQSSSIDAVALVGPRRRHGAVHDERSQRDGTGRQ